MNAPPPTDAVRPPFRPWRLIGAVTLALLAISMASRWYARDLTLPRYCEDPEHVLSNLRAVLTEREPAGNGARRPYLTAARLLFLVPRAGDEPPDAYLERLRVHLEASCPP